MAEASKILSVSRNVGPNSQTRIFPLFTQDGLEFSTPRIENPIYDFAGGCYEGRQDSEHTYDPRLPLHGSGAPSPPLTSAWLPSFLLGLSTLAMWLLFCDSG